MTTDRPGGVIGRIEAYYRAHPHAELTYRAIVDRFGCRMWTARKAVGYLVEIGVLESRHVVRVAREPEHSS